MALFDASALVTIRECEVGIFVRGYPGLSGAPLGTLKQYPAAVRLVQDCQKYISICASCTDRVPEVQKTLAFIAERCPEYTAYELLAHLRSVQCDLDAAMSLRTLMKHTHIGNGDAMVETDSDDDDDDDEDDDDN